jgi:hypothetical protein
VEGGGVARHHVRPIDEEGDPPEAFRLTLGEESVLGDIKADQLGVLLGPDTAHRLQRERVGHARETEMFGIERVLFSGQNSAIHHDRLQLQPVAIEPKRGGLVRRLWIAPQDQPRANPRVVLEQRHVEIDARDEERGRGVILEVNGLRCWRQHPHVLPPGRAAGIRPDECGHGERNGRGRRGAHELASRQPGFDHVSVLEQRISGLQPSHTAPSAFSGLRSLSG